MKKVFDGSGKSISLGTEIGRGGEGLVYDVENSPQKMVAKLYHTEPSPEKSDKLATMARLRNEKLSQSAAWPISTLHKSRNGPVVGFLMPKIEDSKEIHSLYGVKPRRRSFPKADWLFLIVAARNLAASVARIHQEGHIIGDLNQRNIVVSQGAIVRIIDCDSFQIQADGKTFFCDVGTPEFTPPELQGKSLPGLTRSQNHDNFGLALVVFHLLFMGRHPFSGRFLGPGDMSIDRAIREFRFAFGQNAATQKKMKPPPQSVDLGTLPTQVANMFETAFSQKAVFSGRPTAYEWFKTLDTLRQQLIVCPQSTSHKYHRSVHACPWCKLETETGVTFFPVAAPPAIDIEIDIDLLWQRILGVNPPPAAPLPDYRFSNITGAAVPTVTNESSSHRQLEEMQREVERRRKRHSTAKHDYDTLVQSWKDHSANKEFERQRHELELVRSTLTKLHTKFEQDKHALTQNSRASQLQRYLDSFTIDDAEIPNVGEVRKIGLISYGIETAADVEYQKVIAVPGIGDTIAQSMVFWRNQIERKFVYNPNRGVDPAQLIRLQHQYAITARPLRRQLEAGPDELKRIRDRINAARNDLRVELGSAAMALSQSQADLEIAETRLTELKRQTGMHRRLIILRRAAIAAAATAAIVLMLNGSVTQQITQGMVGLLEMIWPAPEPVVPTVRILVATTVPTRLYAAPGEVMNTVAYLPPGRTAYAIARSNQLDWLQIETSEGDIGWVHRSLIDVADPEYVSLPLAAEFVEAP